MSFRPIVPITIDFETEEIEGRPAYPPKPVGFSIMNPGERHSKYYAWGHPSGNNCDKEKAMRVLQIAWRSKSPLVFHNAKFDVDVAQTHMGCGPIEWERVHDTAYLAFLQDPHATALKLKSLAETWLGMPPTEQEELRQWLVDQKITRRNDNKWGRFICKAPGDIVGKYADGDVIRTQKLFLKLYPEIVKRGMLEAYNRERELMPILLRNEREGICVDVKALEQDIQLYGAAVEKADKWLRKRLKTKELNLDSNEELADALEQNGIVTDWIYTETGKRSTAKKNMTVDMFHDKKVASVLGYRNRALTCIGTFMQPWYAMSEKSGRIYTNWNQTRGDNDKGTRTGRFSSNPNFQNVPKDFYDKNDGYVHPKFLSLPELPLMRRYILPDKGQLFCHRDYNQQELRVLAHFEDDRLCAEYNANPTMDIHTFVQTSIAELTGLKLERRAVKILNFGLVYGMGLGKLAHDMQVTVEDAKKVKNAQQKAIPGLKELDKDIKERAKAGEPIRTWGGREYYVEPPKVVDGRRMTFEYKLLNYLIQGSSADCTKQALINYDKIRKEGRFLVTVHDEINISAPKKAAKAEMELLKEAMEGVGFDVPMVSDGKIGKNWLECK